MIAVIDYKSGNIVSLLNALSKLKVNYQFTADPKTIEMADKVIFPGVGAAGAAMKELRKSGLDQLIPRLKQPFLGICLGMQLLFESSEENNSKCLGVIDGIVRKFPPTLKVPQIGWNRLNILSPLRKKGKKDPIFGRVTNGGYFYFVNSYYVDAGENSVIAESEYSLPFAAVIRKDNFYGMQFHPEKSGEVGLKLLNNFCKQC